VWEQNHLGDLGCQKYNNFLAKSTYQAAVLVGLESVGFVVVAITVGVGFTVAVCVAIVVELAVGLTVAVVPKQQPRLFHAM
jgi:hypothetical protein